MLHRDITPTAEKNAECGGIFLWGGGGALKMTREKRREEEERCLSRQKKKDRRGDGGREMRRSGMMGRVRGRR